MHVRNGNTDDRSQWGAWADEKINNAIKLKERHYKPYKHNSSLCFLPMVISTYGYMCDDLLRLLWFIAEAQFDLATLRGAVDLEMPKRQQIQLFAARIRSRIACATAVGVAKRLACLPTYDFRQAKSPTPPDSPPIRGTSTLQNPCSRIRLGGGGFCLRSMALLICVCVCLLWLCV